MTYNTHTLFNGLRLIHLSSSSPVVYCGYEICAGTRDEEACEEGMAHFCEHTTFKGTMRRSSMQVLNCLERVGGDLNAFTNKEDTVYYTAILKDHLSLAVDLLTDMVFHSVYPPMELEKEKEVICDEIESYNDSPSELIYDEFENAIFAGHPLGHNILGRAERLREYTHDDIVRFTGKFYKPENAIFFAYGDIEFGKLVRMLEKATCGFPNNKPLINVKPKFPVPAYVPKELTIEKNTHQAHVMIGNRGYDVHDKKRMALYLLNNMIGGPGMNARLNVVLREKHGLVYTVESSTVNYSDTGIWSTYFGCDPDDVIRCLMLVRHELDKVMQKQLTASQLSAAKKQIKGQIGVACDNRESFALDFGKSFLHYGWEKDITALFRDIDKIAVEDIQFVANEVFDKERITTLIYK
ncbi:MAG: insulinase family protein [Prevotella sp.]|nr:insulinase family protein [Prevotella sp.]